MANALGSVVADVGYVHDRGVLGQSLARSVLVFVTADERATVGTVLWNVVPLTAVAGECSSG